MEDFKCSVHLEHSCKDEEPKPNQELKIELMKQLHEQYAQNNNAYMGHVIKLFVGMLAVFSGFAYVAVRVCPATNPFGYKGITACFNINTLLMVDVACFFVVALMQIICINRGATQRFEQFIIHSIRLKAVDKIEELGLYKGYDPFGKEGLDFIQGLYKILFVALFFIYIFIVVVSSFIIYNSNMAYDYACCKWGCFSIVLCSAIIAFCFVHSELCCKQCKYGILEEKYKKCLS